MDDGLDRTWLYCNQEISLDTFQRPVNFYRLLILRRGMDDGLDRARLYCSCELSLFYVSQGSKRLVFFFSFLLLQLNSKEWNLRS